MELTNEKLHKIFEENEIILTMYSQYLNHTPQFLTEELVENLAKECKISTHDSFLALFGAACGLDCAENASHRRLEQLYLRTGVKCLNVSDYQADPYYQSIAFPEIKHGKWELKMGAYAPYEPFVRTHPTVTEELREIPQLGYFTTEFPFPAVLENGVEWMTVTPNEIETMRAPIQAAHGRVLTLGLGLGYFAFCTSQKEDVESVTVIERDREVIELFEHNLLPQFPHRKKIKILCTDAFDFLEKKLLDTDFDYLFADLWHDASDGLELSIRIKHILKKHPTLQTDYWIEPSLLSSLRRLVYERLTSGTPVAQAKNIPLAACLKDEFLKDFTPELR